MSTKQGNMHKITFLACNVLMLRTIYCGKKDILWYLIQKSSLAYTSMHQWVACPEKGDILLSFAVGETSAHECPVQYFNMYKLLEAKPP